MHEDLAAARKDFEAGRWLEAEEALRRLSSEPEGGPDPLRSDVLFWLGRAQWFLGREEESEATHRRALALREASLPADHPDIARSIHAIGMIHAHHDEFEAAEPLVRRAFDMRMKRFGPSHEETGESFLDLGTLYLRSGKLDEATRAYESALSILRAAHGEDHDLVAVTTSNLGSVLQAQGRDAEAETMLRRALAIRERIQGPEHASLAVTLGNLAVSLDRQHRPSEAEETYARALAIHERTLPPDHPLIANVLTCMATVWGADPRSAVRAEPLWRRALAVRVRKVPLTDTIAREQGQILWGIYDFTGGLRTDPLHTIVRHGLRGRLRALLTSVLRIMRFSQRALLIQGVVEAGRRCVLEGSDDDAEALFAAAALHAPNDLLSEYVTEVAVRAWKNAGRPERAEIFRSAKGST